MNLIRMILIALAVWLIWRLWRRFTQPSVDKPDQPRPVQQMVRCAHCGTHVPEDQAVRGPGGVYCSAAHRDAGTTDK